MQKSLILAGYNKKDLLKSIEFCNRNFWLIPKKNRVVVINNISLVEDSSILKKAKDWQILAGTNQQYEFSAWQEGLGYLKNNISGDFSTIFLNDTVLTHRYFSVARKFAFLTGLLLFGNSNKPRYIGFTNKLKDKSRYTILNYSATSWVSTYLFFMNNLALQAIDYKIWSKEQNEQSVNGGYNKQNFFSESISQNLKEWLIKWLFEDGGWYKSEPLSEANYKFFEIKAKSIINEKYLSAKLNSVGGQIIDPFIRLKLFSKINRFLTKFYGKKNKRIIKSMNIFNSSCNNILFFPDYSRSNPYQTLLYGAIHNQLDIGASGFREKQLFTKEFLAEKRKEHEYLHLHWLHLFVDFKDDLVFYDFIDKVLYARELGYKIIWTVHNLVSHGSANEKKELGYYKLFSKFVDVVLVHSNIAKDMIVELYEVDSERVFVVPHGNYVSVYDNTVIRATARKLLNISEDEFVFLYFGMIRSYKGVEKLTEIFSALSKKYSKVKLLIIGKPTGQDIVTRIKALGEKNIILVDRFVDDKEIQNYFNATDIVVLPFDKILTSGSTLLALSFRKPVIVPKKGVLPELIDDKIGFLFDGEEELSCIMENCLNDWESGSFSGKFALSSFDDVISQTEWDFIIRKYFSVATDFLKSDNLVDLSEAKDVLSKKIKQEKFFVRRIYVKTIKFFNKVVDKVSDKLTRSL